MTDVQSGDTVRVHYTLKLADGTPVESSIGREPLQFQVGAVRCSPGERAGSTARAPERLPPLRAWEGAASSAALSNLPPHILMPHKMDYGTYGHRWKADRSIPCGRGGRTQPDGQPEISATWASAALISAFGSHEKTASCAPAAAQTTS